MSKKKKKKGKSACVDCSVYTTKILLLEGHMSCKWCRQSFRSLISSKLGLLTQGSSLICAHFGSYYAHLYLFYHSKVKWLSQGKVLQWLLEMWNETWDIFGWKESFIGTNSQIQNVWCKLLILPIFLLRITPWTFWCKAMIRCWLGCQKLTAF